MIYGKELDITEADYLPLLSSLDQDNPYTKISAEIIIDEKSKLLFNHLKFKPKTICDIEFIESVLEVMPDRNGIKFNEHKLSFKVK